MSVVVALYALVELIGWWIPMCPPRYAKEKWGLAAVVLARAVTPTTKKVVSCMMGKEWVCTTLVDIDQVSKLIEM